VQHDRDRNAVRPMREKQLAELTAVVAVTVDASLGTDQPSSLSRL
jgi:hypothetical protein